MHQRETLLLSGGGQPKTLTKDEPGVLNVSKSSVPLQT